MDPRTEQTAHPRSGPGREARKTLQDVLLTIAPARSAIADFCVLWQAGALLSTSREMLRVRAALLDTRTKLKGRRGAHRISRAGLRMYTEGCPKLFSVDLSGCYQITDACVIALSQGCPQLSSLDLSYYTQITDACVIALSQGCPQLSSVDLSGCSQITDACVIALWQGSPQLSSVDLSECEQITDAGYFSFSF